MSQTVPARLCSYPQSQGELCKSPALTDKRFCYYHQRDHDRRMRLAQNLDHRRSCIAKEKFHELHCVLPDGSNYDDNSAELFADLQAPNLDDGNSIQQHLSTVYHAISTHQVDIKAGYLLLYNLQIASSNLKNVHPPYSDSRRLAAEDPSPIHRLPGFDEVCERAREKAKAMAAATEDNLADPGTDG